MSVKRISMGKEKITIKRKKALCGRISQKLCKTGIAAYICIVVALFGSFICGIYNIPIWYMLIFHSYTDIKSRQLYVFPIRLCIVVEFLALLYKYGFSYENYCGLFLCLAAVFILKILRVYAQGDMEIFFMLIMGAAVKGVDIAMYSFRLVYGSMIIFCVMFGIYFIVYNIWLKLKGKSFMKTKKAPMVPAISIAYILCCAMG